MQENRNNENLEEKKAPPSSKRKILFAVKILFSISILVVIFRKVILREGAQELLERIKSASLAWILAAIAMQLLAIGCSTIRWQRLLKGQGIRPSWSFLGSSIMIARFWGAFTPGGFTGFGGWRIYDVAKHTGKTARAAATIGVEMILGQLAFGVVVMLGSVFGIRFIGLHGVVVVNLVLLLVIIVGISFVTHPRWFLSWVDHFPEKFKRRVRSLVDAVVAYQGKTPLLLQAVALGLGTHTFNNLIFVCAARALGVELTVGEVFFASSLQILATLVPASINGIGIREAAAVALYTSPAIGLPLSVAVLIPTLGFMCEMFVSAFGGLFFLARKADYDPKIIVEAPEREDNAQPLSAQSPKPHVALELFASLSTGVRAGALAGIFIGLIEACIVAAQANGQNTTRLFLFALLVYAFFGACVGAFSSVCSAFVRQWLWREMHDAKKQFRTACVATLCVIGIALSAFRVRRDVFHEEIAWKSAEGILLFGGVVMVVILIAWLLGFSLSKIISSRRGGWLEQRWWALPVIVLFLLALVAIKATFFKAQLQSAKQRPLPTDMERPNILFIVVDTLRADHLPIYGYNMITTPHLDALAKDAMVFEHAFSNSSWTRPSFASLLTGLYASSHGAMAKNAALPNSIETLAESLAKIGYATAGFVTNFNVAPFFNFDQGFDEYYYLEPDFVLGADDLAAKLLAVQWLKQKIERYRALRGSVLPGTAYQDAEIVNKNVSAWLHKAVTAPWFLFVAYMDPHDPYFEHPYQGTGYSRAAHPFPTAEEAGALIKLYDGEIHYWDEQFGSLIALLKERGLYDAMTIVITSDHGEEFYEHKGFWHGTTLYDEQVHVPLIVKLPFNARAGQRVSHWVQSIDIMPTLLEQARVAVPTAVQGTSLFKEKRLIFAEENHEGNVLASVREKRSEDAYKLIRANPENPRGLKGIELYQVNRDPGELQDLATERSEIVAQHQTLLEQHASGQVSAVTNEVTLDQETTDRLKALGYVQ